jgi:hypothetical protein
VIANRYFVADGKNQIPHVLLRFALDGADMIFDLHAGQDHITLDVNSNASQMAFVGFEDWVENVPASGPTLNLFGCQGEGRQCRS